MKEHNNAFYPYSSKEEVIDVLKGGASMDNEIKKVSFECGNCHKPFEIEDPNESLEVFLKKCIEELGVQFVYYCDDCEDVEIL